MMKNYSPKLRLQHYLIFIAFIASLFLSSPVLAQRAESIERGVLRIKVSEELATQLENTRTVRTVNNVILTGIKSLDNVGQRYKVNTIKRVFRSAGKFEAKHRRYGLHRWYEIKMDNGLPVLEALTAYQQIKEIEKCEPVYTKSLIGSKNKNFGPVIINTAKANVTLPGASNDPLLSNQWHYNNTGQVGGVPGADIKLFQAWGLETGKTNVIVAVTDGGIQASHPDIVANTWINAGEIPGNNIDDDSNGFVDDINGYGFGDDSGTIAPDQHGTHVGGTVAATTNNGIGVAGVAGGSGVGDGAKLMSCAAFGANDSGGFAETYVYAADNGAVISQNSWGYDNIGAFEQAVLDGIDYFVAEAGQDEVGNQVGPMKGGIVIFSAGNDDDDDKYYPGYYASTIAVSGINNRNEKAWYSNYGTWVDIAATGGDTNSVNQRGVLSTLSNNQYGYFQGTSMAAPHVSGVAALIISKFGGPGLTPATVKARLLQTTDNIDVFDPEFTNLLGSGRLNAFASLQENDNISPNAITNLASITHDITSVTLTWTAPVDEGNGSASSYDIRYSTSPIDSSNFLLATTVTNPPIPRAAGTQEVFTISNLSGGTVYYFAVKSLDFFGNASRVSNIEQQATDFPPIISFSPSVISDTLQTAATSVKSLTILNTGKGPLVFSIANFEGGFVKPSIVADTILPNGHLDISLTLSANNLLAGTYTKNLKIYSNDPVKDTLSVPIVLYVINNGFPIAVVSPRDTLNLGGVFVEGSKSKTITVHNSGSEVLVVGNIVVTGAGFTSNFSDSISIAPFHDASITITLTPLSLGTVQGALVITTNDPINTTNTITLIGEGLVAPSIAVSPSSFDESLYEGKSLARTLTVSNNGGSDLEVSIEVSAAINQSVATKQVTLPSRNSSPVKQYAKKMKASSSEIAQKIEIKSTGKSGGSKVLIITPDEDVVDILAILNSYDDIDAVAFPHDSLPLISVNDLLKYDVVLTTNNGQWLSAGGIEPAAVGDLLADYVDQGGKLIINQFGYSYDAWKMEGRFITQQYGPFIPSTTDEDTSVALGDILNSSHPILSNVDALDYEGFVQNVGLAPGATALAKWSNGEFFLATNASVVALNLLPSLGDGSALPWQGDLPTLYQNAIHWLSGPTFVKVNPKKAIVAPGEQVDLAVTFNAAGLTTGDHFASINIATNIPNEEVLPIPVTLHILGPEFSVAPDSLVEVLDKGNASTKTIILTNNGSESHAFNVSVQNNGVLEQVAVNKHSVGLVNSKKIALPTFKREKEFKGVALDLNSIRYIPGDKTAQTPARTLGVSQHAILYTTDFEYFSQGDINDQQGWGAQYGNWVVDTSNPSSGSQHLHSIADGQGQTLAFSPQVGIGTKEKSTVTAKINLQGTGVTWQIIPQSISAEVVNTRISFGADGTIQALVSDGAEGAFYENIPTAIPTGYFDLTIEVDRASSVFDLYFNEQKIFTGLGFAGNIEEVVLLSLMEEEGPTFDVDDLKIFDGKRDLTPSYIKVTPISGTIAAGESVAIAVAFDSKELNFGKYQSDVIISIADADRIVVPTYLEVKGSAAIEIHPTVLQATVAYKEDTTKSFEIKNTGGVVLNYSMQVIGAGTTLANLPATLVTKSSLTTGKRIEQKVSTDIQRSKAVEKPKQKAIELLAGAGLLEENFEESFPPASWSVKDIAGNGVTWAFASAYGEGNYTGTGEAATASSDAFGEADFDTELRTPYVDISKYQNITVQYMANYQNYANYDFLDLDIRVDGDSTWQNVLRWNEDHGELRELSGEFVSISLDEYLTEANSFQLRWHYYDPNEADYDWYAQVDNVVILGDPRAWLSLSPVAGQIPVGGKEEIKAHFNARDLEPGFYVAGILVNSNAVKNPLIGIVASLTVLEPAIINVTPNSLSQSLLVGETAIQELLVSNEGVSPLKFSFEGVAIQGATDKLLERKSVQSIRTSFTKASIDIKDRRAITKDNYVSKNSGSFQYATGFEEFAPGDIDDQNNWAGQYGNWTIEAENPYDGSLHFRGQADGLGQSLAFSPEVGIGVEVTSSTTMKVNLSNSLGATWQIIPQSVSKDLVNTRVMINADGSLQALVVDSLGEAYYDTIKATAPVGYFSLKIEIDRATAVFRIFFNDEKVFVGQGFAGDIEEVVLLSFMETAGPILDIDNLAILDGAPQAPWLAVNPLSGVVPAGESLSVNITFDAATLVGGNYSDTLNIIHNDPNHSTIQVPVLLTVIDNLPPVLEHVSDTTVVETGSIKLSFAATDPDNDDVKISLQNAPSFVTIESQAYGKATYVIKPLVGDKGVYTLNVIARDARGLSDSLTLQLTVIPYGVESFSLVNVATGKVLVNFTDSLKVDLANPDFFKYTIRANTNPAKVGSVVFKLDGHKENTENIITYDLDRLAFASLGVGNHALRADAYTKASGKGTKAGGKSAVISVVNVVSVTSFDVVNIFGKVLMQLKPGSIINIKDPSFNNISIVARTTNSKIGSVYFKLNTFYHTENIAPFSLNGNLFGFFLPWPFSVGKYSITATPYSKPNHGGVAGKSLTINFEVVKERVGSPFAAREATATDEDYIQGVDETKDSEWRIYPVPVQGELNLLVEGEQSGDVEIVIINTQGQVVHRENLPTEKLISSPINATKFAPGAYYLQLINSVGKRTVKKFIKN